MRINRVRYLKGPNYFSYKPTMFIEVDIEDLEFQPSDTILGFNETLVKALPGLEKHTCSIGYEGGFVERLNRGTWMGHILEHVAIELQTAAGIDVKRGKTITGEKPGIYYVTYSYKEAKSGLYSFEAAMEIAGRILKGEKAINAGHYIDQVADLYFKHKLGPSTEAIYDAATQAKVPVQRIGEDSLLRLGTGSRQKFVQATISSQTSNIAVENSCDKQLTKEILKSCGLPVPEGKVATSMEEIFEMAARLGFPLVIKPLNGRQGQGVITNIKNKDELFNVVNCLEQHVDKYILERYYEGNDYRLLVVDDSLIAASLRVPPFIIGNGKDTIQTLIKEENKNPLRGDGHEKAMSKIPLNHIVSCYLEKLDLTLHSVPDKGKIIQVVGNANLSTGGKAIDVTDQVHPTIKNIAVTAAKAIGLDIAGIDFICKDISKPFNNVEMAIIEINAAPGIRMHHFPSEGKKRDVGKAIVDYLFRSREESAIPIISVTGTNGKTTTARLINHFLSKEGVTVGMANSDGVYINNVSVDEGDCSGPVSARKILSNPAVDFAVLETARGGILREGLAFQQCEVGVVTNVTEDHLGIDGIDTFEQLVKLKRLIPEVVMEDGFCILNADDENVAKMADYSNGQIIYTSIDQENPNIRKAISGKMRAWFVDDSGWIVYASQGILLRILPCKEIPITIGGSARHNISNLLQAMAAAYTQGVPLNELKQKALSFTPDADLSKGRFNKQEMKGRTIIVDYAHNVAGMEAIYDTVSDFDKKRVITVLASPGDRKDEDIKNMAYTAAGHTDLIVIKEDDDLRDREQYEVANIIQAACLEKDMIKQQAVVVLNELDAFKKAWELSEPGDMLLFFYTDFDYVNEFFELVGKHQLQ
ncbi:cyanophycin synthetase [Peribacillus cavernae]|uniref:Cyanophycin synthetase n=1 Tax=Peribacillus cavernae TaxID=1674310 RepID=A0A433HPI1_9BACI|nr:cyanophycin synthetase [Peribacillus cavernae]MDQ0217338.1 cyanophycin synthetase [Peribacillus cavernae]RUQ30208.1 cyanophycin synthetase [Peribacillus cavernae]